jgi:hypothetical protein
VPLLRTVVNGEVLELALSMLRLSRHGGPNWYYVSRRFAVERLGPLDIEAPTLRFTYSESFGEDALGGRVPLEPREVVVRGQPQRVTVVPLPAEGRPAQFGGGVGTFTLASTADRTEVEMGQTFRLTLTIEGDGNLEVLEAPRPDASVGLHVYGVTDDHEPWRRTVVYDLAAQRAGLTAVPAMVLVHFDPHAGAYRTAITAPIPLTVRATSRTPQGPAWKPVEEDDGGTPLRFLVAGSAAALVLVGGALWIAYRRRRRKAAASLDPEAERLLTALVHLRARTSEPGADLSEPFAEVLAARLRQPRAAAVAPDLAARLTTAGVAPDVATEAATTMERLVQARYGGAALDPAARDRILTLAARLVEPGGQVDGR